MTILPEFIEFSYILADAGAAICRKYFRSNVSVESKADATPVSIADREAEAAMRTLIKQRYPDHGILGEEEGAYQPEAKYVWGLDPIDGTRSFLHGFPTFTLLISLVRLGVPVLGLIDQPYLNERWLGVSSQPTSFNGNTIRTRTCASLKDAHFSTTSPFLFEQKAQETIARLCHNVTSTQFGYDGYAYAQLSSGRLDAIVESGLKAHDFCALRPVIEGAGGIISDWKGAPLTLASDGKVIAAGDARVHAELVSLLSSFS